MEKLRRVFSRRRGAPPPFLGEDALVVFSRARTPSTPKTSPKVPYRPHRAWNARPSRPPGAPLRPGWSRGASRVPRRTAPPPASRAALPCGGGAERVPVALPVRLRELVRLRARRARRRARRLPAAAQPHQHRVVGVFVVSQLLLRQRAGFLRHVLVQALAGGHGDLVVVPRAPGARAVTRRPRRRRAAAARPCGSASRPWRTPRPRDAAASMATPNLNLQARVIPGADAPRTRTARRRPR